MTRMDTRLCSVVLFLMVTAAAWLPLASSQDGVEGCSFEVIDGVVSTCDLQTNGTRFGETSWRTSSAATAVYLGGPKTDEQDTNDTSPGQGGYVVALVSDMKGTQRPLKAWLLTNVSPATQPQGRCLEFAYAVSELGVSSLQVLLLTYTSPDVQEALENTSLPLTYTTRSLWEVRDSTQGQWKRAHVTFSTLDTHSLVFSASSKTRFSSHRGYAAVDDITFKEGPCDDDCMFDVDLCTWANTELGDDFDWDVGRSSGKRGTGPSKDQASYINHHIINIITGGYAYIDSGYPRRPYDRALLESRVLPPLTIQHCLHFWVNMNGGGLGNLRVFSRATDGNGTDILLWGMWESISGTDSWNECQQTVASNEEFQILFEASVRVPGAGDISLDTITLTEGSCPSLPSGLKTSWVDCTFLVDICNWSLEPPNGASLSRVSSSNTYNPPGHTQSVYKITDMYMKFELSCFKCQARTSEALVSPSRLLNNDHCLSFWVYMYTTIASLTHIGALKVVLRYTDRNVTVWYLLNQQQADWTYSQVTLPANSTNNVTVAIEGVQGPHVMGMIGVDDITVAPIACPVKPEVAKVEAGDCTFNRDLCLWEASGGDDSSSFSSSANLAKWHLADNSPLKDHTFEADEGGYAYMETFNRISKSNLTSPLLPSDTFFCFTFWFSHVYRDTADLKIYRVPDGGGQGGEEENEEALLWEYRLDADDEDETPTWQYGQLPLDPTNIDYRVVIAGMVTRSGWAVDDVKFYTSDTNCRVYPTTSSPV